MRLQVRTLPEGEEQALDLDEGATGFQLLEALERNPEAHLLLRGKVPIPMDTRLEEGEDLAVVAVVSGGVSAAAHDSNSPPAVAQPF